MLCCLVSLLVHVDAVWVTSWLLLSRDEKCDDKSVDTAGLAKNDTDEVLRLDSRHLDHRTENGGGGDEDAPNAQKKV